MHNVFIAIGGSGTKVAEMLVRLLGVGFPTTSNDGILTSANDTLEIWCIDPDRSSASLASLKNTVNDYVELQALLADPKTEADQGRSGWSMAIDPTCDTSIPCTSVTIRAATSAEDPRRHSRLRRSRRRSVGPYFVSSMKKRP